MEDGGRAGMVEGTQAITNGACKEVFLSKDLERTETSPDIKSSDVKKWNKRDEHTRDG